jgi:glycine cleavage system aminomethyltransferase T
LGYELNIPSEQATHVYDMVVDKGKALGLRHAGLKALASLRMEKAYRDYGHDIDNTDDAYSVGLGFAVSLKKENDFIGKEACAGHKARLGQSKRLVQVLVDDPQPLMYHGEIVLRDGVPVGEVRAASYGHTLGGAVGLAMVEGAESEQNGVDKAYLDEGKWEVNIAGQTFPASVSLRPLYDPTMERIKA